MEQNFLEILLAYGWAGVFGLPLAILLYTRGPAAIARIWMDAVSPWLGERRERTRARHELAIRRRAALVAQAEATAIAGRELAEWLARSDPAISGSHPLPMAPPPPEDKKTP